MSSDRDSSRDRELVRHRQSFSAGGLHIPMWDSSDPERAPPPLPLNPGSPNLTTRPNTSAAIANAAKALEEKARESLPMSSYTTNPMPQRSPERSLIKGAHKRMQSLQPSGVRDLRSYLDTHKSPEKSPERPVTRGGTPPRESAKDYFGSGGDQSPRFGSPTPSRDGIKDTAPLRASTRPLQKAILGENTNPSATMMALQNMTIPPHIMDPPLSDVTNSASAKSPPPAAPAAPESLDAISNQLASITNIVSNLQKDMSQLSRRSKDNATDLVSLKDATNSRDEDIRKSLKDLLNTVNQAQQAASTPGGMSRTGSNFDFKDPHMTPTKSFSLPRIPSPNSFLDERIGSPNPYSVEGAASVAMLEKIIREMVTKDGQERLIANLETLVDKANGETAKKVAELVEFVKSGSANNAFGSPAPSGSAAFQASPGTGPLTRTTSDAFPLNKVSDGGKPYTSPKAADFVSEEMLKFLRKIKDSVTEAGGVSDETKSLVQELREEVLSMGRDIARKIEENEVTRALEPNQPTEDVGAIIQEGLADLKEHLDTVMRERRRQSISSNVTRNTVDANEVYDVVRSALAERGMDQQIQASQVDQEAIIAAIREAWNESKPDVQIEQYGLERDEILECLREGLQEYRGSGNVTKEEIEVLIQDGIQSIKLPPPINEANEIREEVLMAVRECLEEFKPSLVPHAPPTAPLTQEEITNAVREGLSIDIDQEHLIDAMQTAVDTLKAQDASHDDEVLQRLQGLLDEMQSEFKSYSSANGRETEQVLDALRDGLDGLRGQIEGYIDKAQDVTNKDEIVDQLHAELEQLRVDVKSYVAESAQDEDIWRRPEMVEYFKTEFDKIETTLNDKLTAYAKHTSEIIEALNAGFEGIKSQVATRDADADSNEEINEAMKQEFTTLKEVVLGDTTTSKDEILEKLQAGFDGLQTCLGETASANNNDEILATLKEEFDHLRETLGGALVRGSGADKDDIVDAVRELIDGLRSAHETTTKDSVNAIQEGLDNLKESIGGALVRSNDTSERDDMLQTVKIALEEIKASTKSMDFNEELLEAFRGELEQVRQSNGLIRQSSRADAEEVMEALRLGLDDLRSHVEKKLDNPERHIASTNEIIDNLNEGLEGIRADVTKVAEKPIDMTISYEILETLKEGIAGLREEITKLKEPKDEPSADEEPAPAGTEVVLAEDPEQATSREIVNDSLRRDDIEKMELMLGQLQVKVEAMDANIQNHPPPPEPAVAAGTATKEDLASVAMKEDLASIVMKDDLASVATKEDLASIALKEDLASVESLLKELAGTVQALQERETPVPSIEGMATKEDTDAIETLLSNVKAKIEEFVFPDPATAVTKENLDDVELVVRTTSDALDTLAKKIEEEGATKGDVTVVQVIADDIKVALDEMKESAKAADETDPRATKADVESLTLLLDEMKIKVEGLKIPDPEEIPTKADVEQLTGLVNDFRESHENFKESYEKDIHTTSMMFDHRKQEAEALSEALEEVKTALGEFREDIKTNLIEGGPIEGLQASFKTLEETIGSSNVTADVKELMETVSREFERAHGSIEGLQNDQAEKSALQLEKHDEAKEAVITAFNAKVDDRFDTLMAKYDDAQLLADELAKVMKEKTEEQEKILESTKAMAEELRLTIDTLGASITGMNDRFEDATNKWSTDSATVFSKIDDTITKLDEQKLEDKTEHSHTRDELKNIESIFTGLQDNVTEYHPKFMVALHEIEALVKAHYEFTQKAKEAADEHIQTVNEEAKARAEELGSQLSALPALLPPPPPAIELPEKYDDAPVQEKLDKLIGHAEDTTTTTTQLERLEEIHAQVKVTAAEVTEFVAKQTQLITDGNEAKEREAEELALMVERRMAQKEQLEADLENLKAEKERIIQEAKEEKERAAQELKEERERAQEERERLVQEFKEERERHLQESKEEREKALQESKEEREQAVQEAKAERERVLEEAKEERERALEEAKEERARALQELKEEREKHLQELKEEKERALQEAKEERELSLLESKEERDRSLQESKEERERVLEELRGEKERVMAELKEEKEQTIIELKEEKDSLLAIVAALQAERENLANQKVRLTGEVSSLHTALDIRREELHMMDIKADALERRILNGIMDHSRALMIAKGGSKSPNKSKKRMSVDPSDPSKLMPNSAAANGLSFALKPRPAIRRNGPPANPASRRIHSLSQISGNAPSGAQGYLAAGNNTSNGGLKRSHSVKTNNMRKISWGGRPSAVVANKENEPLGEEDETETEQTYARSIHADDASIAEEGQEDAESEAGTQRRHSISTYAESYADGETPSIDGRRSSYGAPGSEYTYDSGSSYMTGSDVDRRVSYGSSAAPSTLTYEDQRSELNDSESEGSDAEDDEPTAILDETIIPSEAASEAPTNAETDVPAAAAPSEITASEVSTATADSEMSLPTDSEVNRAVEAVREDIKENPHLYAAPSDSGVGSELPTAALEGDGAKSVGAGGEDPDYFRRMAEEESVVG